MPDNPLLQNPKLRHMAEMNGIVFPTLLPLYRSAPVLEHLNEWAESQATPTLRKISHTLVKNINYIPFESFLKALKETITDFNQHIGDKPFILLIAENREDKLANGCSDQWVAGLAFEHCQLKQPTAIFNINQLRRYLKQNPTIPEMDILILDDASYSARQKSEALSDLISNFEISNFHINNFEENDLKERFKTLHLWMGIPFMTEQANKAFAGFQKDFQEVTILTHQHMPLVIDFLTKDEQYYMKSISCFTPLKVTLTWFDHRFPDDFSTFASLYWGKSLIDASISKYMAFLGYDAEEMEVNEYNGMVSELFAPNYLPYYNIPRVLPPYHLGCYEGGVKLCQALIENSLGEETPYHELISKDLQAIIIKLRAGATPNERVHGYKRPALEEGKQLAFDESILLRHKIRAGQEQFGFLDMSMKTTPTTIETNTTNLNPQ